MTLADLGKQLKQVHPEYRDVPDASLGKALQAKFSGFYGHVTDEPELDANTVPEAPRTIAIQMAQLANGLRRVVFVARGSKTKIDPADYGVRRITLPSGSYFYDPSAIKPQEIIKAVMTDELADILGSSDKGYGTSSKQQLQGEPQAVVARNATGETAHFALADEESIPEAVDVAEELRPEGGSVSVEPPEVEISHRAGQFEDPPPLPPLVKGLKKPKAGDKWAKPKGPVKVP